MNSLKEKYFKEIRPELVKKLSLKNIYQSPYVIKIVVSSKIGRIKEDEKAIKKISDDLALITAQKPKINLSKKSVSAFKLRVGQPVGLTVTLRGRRMYDFIERITKVGMPRIRDFKGLPKKGFDRNGNYCFGASEQIIMPEIKYDNVDQMFGFQVNIKTSTNDDNKARELLTMLGFPFEKSN